MYYYVIANVKRSYWIKVPLRKGYFVKWNNKIPALLKMHLVTRLIL